MFELIPAQFCSKFNVSLEDCSTSELFFSIYAINSTRDREVPNLPMVSQKQVLYKYSWGVIEKENLCSQHVENLPVMDENFWTE